MKIREGDRTESLYVEGKHAKLRILINKDAYGQSMRASIYPYGHCVFATVDGETLRLLNLNEEQIRELGTAMLKIADRMLEGSNADILEDDLNQIHEECEVCEEHIPEEDLIKGVCLDCIDELAEEKERAKPQD